MTSPPYRFNVHATRNLGLVGILLLGTAVGNAQTPTADPIEASRYKQLFPKPTGRNGYEEYLLAAELVCEPQFRSLVHDVEMFRMYKNPRYGQQVPDWVKGKTQLDLDRVVSARSGPVLDLVRKGNLKPISLPRVSNDQSMDSIAELNRVSGVLITASRAHMGDGDFAGGTRILVEQLKFAFHIRSLDVLLDLVGLIFQDRALSTFEPFLDKLSKQDWALVMSTARSQLARPSPTITAMEAERQGTVPRFRAELESATKSKPKPGGKDSDAASTEFAGLSRPEQDKVMNEATRLLNARYKAAAHFARLPDSEWPMNKAHPEPKTLAERLTVDVDSPGMLPIEARRRNQLRLLLVHGLIQTYRLQHHKLPASLDDLHAGKEIIDPFHKEPFVYEVHNGTYELYSKGVGDSGKLELRWRPKKKAAAGG